MAASLSPYIVKPAVRPIDTHVLYDQRNTAKDFDLSGWRREKRKTCSERAHISIGSARAWVRFRAFCGCAGLVSVFPLLVTDEFHLFKLFS